MKIILILGKSALMLASEKGFVEIAKELIKAKADLDLKMSNYSEG